MKRYFFIGGELNRTFEGTGIYELLRDDDIESNIEYLRTCDGIIILVDTVQVFKEYISRTDHKRNNLPTGLYIAQLLRLKGITAPILFTSFTCRATLYNNNHDREILNAVGHDFIQRPVKDAAAFIEALEKIKPLGDLELADVQQSYCERNGKVENVMHDLKEELTLDHGFEEKKQMLINAIGEMSDIYWKDATEIIERFESIYSVINEENIEWALKEVDDYHDRLIRENPSDQSVTPRDKEQRTWKILWVDDRIKKNHFLITLLRRRGVEVILVDSSQSAWERLKEDWETENKIYIVIADYRLYEIRDEVRVHQALQGYGLLHKISMEGWMIRLAALSALSRKFLLQSFRHFNIRTNVYSKTDYLRDEHTMKMFCDELIEMGDEHEEAIISLPDDAAGWKFLKHAYMLYRNHPDYAEMERGISEKAIQFVEYFELHKKFPPVRFTRAIFKEDTETKKTLEKFQQYWLARRLALWLSSKKRELSSVDIRALLIGEPADPKDNTAARNMISQVLGLRLQSFPMGLTVEEQRWFNNTADVKICRHALRKIEQFFKKKLGETPSLFAQIKRDGYSIKIEAKEMGLDEISFNEEGQPMLESYPHAQHLYSKFRDTLDPFDPNLNEHEKQTNNKKARDFARTLKEFIVFITESKEVKTLMHNSKVPAVIELFIKRLSREAGADVSKVFTKEERAAIKKYYDALPDYKGIKIPDEEMEYATQVLLAYDEAKKMLTNPKQKVTFEMVMDWMVRWRKSGDDDCGPLNPHRGPVSPKRPDDLLDSTEPKDEETTEEGAVEDDEE